MNVENILREFFERLTESKDADVLVAANIALIEINGGSTDEPYPDPQPLAA